MSPIAIVTILVLTAIVLANLLVYLKRKIKHEPTGDCAYCHKGTKKMLKDYHKMYSK